jgi:hypothetical protein
MELSRQHCLFILIHCCNRRGDQIVIATTRVVSSNISLLMWNLQSESTDKMILSILVLFIHESHRQITKQITCQCPKQRYTIKSYASREGH